MSPVAADPPEYSRHVSETADRFAGGIDIVTPNVVTRGSAVARIVATLFQLSAQARGDLTWTGIGYLLPILLATGTGIAIARVLGAEGRGALAAIQMLPTVAWGFASLGLPHALTYFIAKDRARTGEFVGTALAVCLPACCLAAAFVALAQPYFLSQFDRPTQWAGILFCLFMPFSAIVALPLSALQSHQRFKAWNLLRLMPQLLYTAVVGAALLTQVASAPAIALGYLVAFGVVGSWITIRVYSNEIGQRLSVTRDAVPALMKYGAAVVLTTAPSVVYQRLDQAVIAVALSPADLGRYVIGVSWASLALISAQIIGAQIVPRLAHAEGSQVRRLLAVAVLAGAAAAIAAGVVLGLSVSAVPVIFGRDFGSALSAFRLLVVSGAAASFGQVLGDCQRGLGRPGIPAGAQWIGTGASAIGLWTVYGHASLTAVAAVAVVASLTTMLTSAAGLWWCLRAVPPAPDAPWSEKRAPNPL